MTQSRSVAERLTTSSKEALVVPWYALSLIRFHNATNPNETVVGIFGRSFRARKVSNSQRGQRFGYFGGKPELYSVPG